MKKLFLYTILFFYVTTIIFPGIVRGLSPEQRRIMDSGALYYNSEEDICPTQGSGGGVAANLNIGTDFSLGTDPAERRTNLMRAFIADFGLTPEQAAGPVGNFMHESGGEHLPPDVNEGGQSGPPRFSGGYGWAQWTGPRQRAFINFAIENGYMSSQSENANDAANYAYLKKELMEDELTTIPALKEQQTPEDAAVSFEATFERAGVPALQQRREGARKAFDEFTGGSAPSGGSSSNCPDQQSTGATIVGDYAFPLLINNKSGVSNPGMFNNNTTDQGGHPYTAFDILANTGVPVAAFMDGIVISIGSDKCPGRFISIYNEPSDLTLTYMHLSFNNHIAQGETVRAGDRIGVVGTTAEGCTVPHLHIDAITGSGRPGCSRENCPSQTAARFVDIGPQLYETFQALPD